MAQTNTAKLDVDDRFPVLTIQMVGSDIPLRLPDDLSAGYTVFLGYRGKW